MTNFAYHLYLSSLLTLILLPYTQPPYSGLRGNRQDNRGGLGSYSMDDLGRDSFARNRGQSSSDRDLIRDGHNMRPPNRGGDGILGAKPGDMPRDLAPNPSSGLDCCFLHSTQLSSLVITFFSFPSIHCKIH